MSYMLALSNNKCAHRLTPLTEASSSLSESLSPSKKVMLSRVEMRPARAVNPPPEVGLVLTLYIHQRRSIISEDCNVGEGLTYLR